MYELKIALQKSGRLHTDSINILKNCGINIDVNLSKLKTEIFLRKKNINLQVFFLRDDDIPKYVQEEIATIGIVGKNVVFEQKKDSLIKEYLNFGVCRLSLAVHKQSLFNNIKDLFGKCIATSYPNLLKNYLNEQFYINHNIIIHKINGSVEITPNIGVADAICDLVSSGKTLVLNDLKEIQKIFDSQAVLICSNNNNILANILISQIKALKKAKDNKYIIFNIPKKKLNKIIYFLHNEKCTIVKVDLVDSTYITIKIIVKNDMIWNIIEELKINNVKNLLVFPIQKYF